MKSTTLPRTAFICLSAFIVAGVAGARKDEPRENKGTFARRYIFEVTVVNDGKKKSELVTFIVGKGTGFGIARGRHICGWNLHLGNATIINNMFVPLVPNAPPSLITLSKIPDVGTLICDELLLETEILTGCNVSAAIARKALRGSWGKAGINPDLPPMEREFVIASVSSTLIHDLPFDELKLSWQSNSHLTSATIRFSSQKLVSFIGQEIIPLGKPTKSEYAESMETLMGYNGGKTIAPGH